MDLLADEPPIDLGDSAWRIYSANQSMPPHFVGPEGSVKSSIIAEGSAILGKVSNSVIFYDVIIEKGARVSDSVIMPGSVIKENAVVEKAIIGERCTVEKGAVVHNGDESVAVLGRGEVVKAQPAKKGAEGK